ncbi:ABC transporter permease [Vallitalea maricola]|uniref:Iron ABC transporter permease n=1 Tax=Vallitalea maricola TaxID=3074433 RepID=A0ACB5UPU8_9FIRM|nr:iron ABC transporter permease [Vallitalea sp. AN17-2]
MKRIRKFFNFWNVTRIIAFATLAVVLIYPFFSMLRESFVSQETGGFTFANYLEFFKYPYYYKTLFNSLSVVITATILSTLIGLPMAYITTRYNIWGKPLINIMIILSLLSPPFIGAYSWILLLGRNGFLTNIFRNIGIELPTIYGWTGIVLVFTLKFFPYVYLFVSGALKSMDSSIEEAAENLGVSGIKKLFTITFPLILPTITAGALMVFMTSLADFGTPMLIGEGYKVLPVLIYEEYMSEIGGNATIASMLSVIIIICAVAILLVQKLVIAKKSYMMSSLRPPKVVKLTKGKRIGLTVFCLVIAGIAMVQQVVVVITSFIKTNGPIFVKGFSLDSYKMIISKLSTNISNTFLYSTIAIIIMVIAGLLLSYLIVRKKSKVNSLLDILIMFPYVIPGAVLGISLLVAFNKGPVMLAGTAWILIIAYVIRKLPYTIRSSTAILYQIDPSIEEASINLGVSPMKTFFKTTARLMAPGVLSGAILSWITTINELSSSVILYTGKTATISVAIYTEVVRASFGTAAALASILTVTTIVSILIFNKISGGKGITM